jgi:hypothetical protein
MPSYLAHPLGEKYTSVVSLDFNCSAPAIVMLVMSQEMASKGPLLNRMMSLCGVVISAIIS